MKANRDCIKDISMFDLHSCTWESCRVINDRYSDVIPQERRNHVACLLNEHMLVFGGINGFNQHLNDVNSFDLI